MIYVFMLALAIAYAFAKFYLGYWAAISIVIAVVAVAFLHRVFRALVRGVMSRRMKVTLRDGRTGYVLVPEGMEMDAAVDALMNASGPFREPSLELTNGEEIKRSWIVSARPVLLERPSRPT